MEFSGIKPLYKPPALHPITRPSRTINNLRQTSWKVRGWNGFGVRDINTFLIIHIPQPWNLGMSKKPGDTKNKTKPNIYLESRAKALCYSNSLASQGFRSRSWISRRNAQVFRQRNCRLAAFSGCTGNQGTKRNQPRAGTYGQSLLFCPTPAPGSEARTSHSTAHVTLPSPNQVR